MRAKCAFTERRMLYERCDQELASKTRFFAAAALTNQLFATMFGSLPRVVKLETCAFLDELGDLLAVLNLEFAHRIRCGRWNGAALDCRLVIAEQRVVTRHWLAFRDRSGTASNRVGKELNALLNGFHLASFIAPLCTHGRRYCGVLDQVRAQSGGFLDFANPVHRVNIGCGLIRHVRDPA